MGEAIEHLRVLTEEQDDASLLMLSVLREALSDDEFDGYVALAVSPGGRPADDSPIGTPGGKQNWVDKAGGLPKYIREIAHALIRKGMDKSHAIATAVNRVKKLAATSTNPKVKSAAAAAVAEWEKKKH